MRNRHGILETPTGRRVPVELVAINRYSDRPTECLVRVIDLDSIVGMGFNGEKTDVGIERVIFNNPATVVYWKDGTKTVVKCQPGDIYSKETGLALCIAKKYLGNKSNFNDVFKKWISTDEKFRIVKTCEGCLGAEGLIGRKTTKPHTDGLFASNSGYNVETEDGNVWRINLDAKIEYLK